MKPSNMRLLSADAAGIAETARILRSGGIAAFPTETVYGLGADARNGAAVASIFAAKGRPSFNPLIVHVADLAVAKSVCHFSSQALKLAAAFWPGPLTLVLPLTVGAGISPLVTAGNSSLAVRVPAHPVAQALLRAAECPLAAPSANPSGRISPTTAAHVVEGLGNRIDAILDAGSCGVGLESTIVLCLENGAPQLLRTGGLPVEQIEACLGQKLRSPMQTKTPTAPGQLASHYAPKGQLRLNATEVRDGETLLGFGPVDTNTNLSATGDLVEAAANLFGHLHRLDAMDVAKIAVSPIPETGLGRAINDRLRRAAAPRGH